jgi:hypothetical protein
MGTWTNDGSSPRRATFAGAFTVGVPAWIVTAVLQPILNADREADGLNGLDDAGERFVGTLAGGGLAMGFCAVVLAFPAMVFGLILTVRTAGAGGPLAALLVVPAALHVAWLLCRPPAAPPTVAPRPARART